MLGLSGRLSDGERRLAERRKYYLMRGDEYMLTRTTITESEKIELRNALHKFRQAEIDKEEAATVIADVLGCHVDEAWTAGERREGMERMLDRYGIEVAPDEVQRHESLAPMERVENAAAVVIAVGLVGVIVWSLWLWWRA